MRVGDRMCVGDRMRVGDRIVRQNVLVTDI